MAYLFLCPTHRRVPTATRQADTRGRAAWDHWQVRRAAAAARCGWQLITGSSEDSPERTRRGLLWRSVSVPGQAELCRAVARPAGAALEAPSLGNNSGPGLSPPNLACVSGGGNAVNSDSMMRMLTKPVAPVTPKVHVRAAFGCCAAHGKNAVCTAASAWYHDGGLAPAASPAARCYPPQLARTPPLLMTSTPWLAWLSAPAGHPHGVLQPGRTA